LFCETQNKYNIWNAVKVDYNDKIKICNIDFYKLKKETRIYGHYGVIISKKAMNIILNDKKILNTADDLFTSLNLNSYIPKELMLYVDFLNIESTIEHSVL
jgi:hypothetical protein